MRLALLAALVCLLASHSTNAQTQSGPPSGPCAADAKKLCPDAAPGHGAVMKCLQEHQADLSAECKEKIAAVKDTMRKRAESLHAACGGDAERLCPGLEAGTGLVKCLYAHEADVGQACRDQMRARGPEN